MVIRSCTRMHFANSLYITSGAPLIMFLGNSRLHLSTLTLVVQAALTGPPAHLDDLSTQPPPCHCY